MRKLVNRTWGRIQGEEKVGPRNRKAKVGKSRQITVESKKIHLEHNLFGGLVEIKIK